MNAFWLGIILVTLGTSSFARSGAAVNQPATQALQELRAHSIFGDREVRFTVRRAKDQISIERVVDGGDLRSRKLKPKEWSFLLREFQKLPTIKNIPPECSRARIDLVLTEPNRAKADSRSSCFGLKTITSDSYVHFAQMLELAFD